LRTLLAFAARARPVGEPTILNGRKDLVKEGRKERDTVLQVHFEIAV